MLVVLSSKTPPNFERCLLVYLYKLRAGVFVGDVTSRVLDYLKAEIPRFVGRGHVYLVWKNSLSPRGFELFEISGDGAKESVDIDGLVFPLV